MVLLFFSCQNSIKNSRYKNLVLNDNEDYLKISYIGNMGVLIENNHKTVLIDGFHKKYKPAYLPPSEGMVDSLVNGKYNGFTEIEVSLATHKHKDHFSPELSLRFLRENKTSLIIGPDQVKEELTKVVNDTIRYLDRIIVIDSDYKVHSIQHEGIHIKSIKCDHTYEVRHKKIQNIAYLIDINGYKILHVGDTDWGLLKDSLVKLNLVESNIDVAILPSWMLTQESSKTSVYELINPNMIMASHIDPNYTHQVIEDIQLRFPYVVCLTELNKTIKFNKSR